MNEERTETTDYINPDWPEWAAGIPDEGVHLPKWRVVQALQWYMLSRDIKRRHEDEHYIDISLLGDTLARVGLERRTIAESREAHHQYGAVRNIFSRLGFLDMIPEDER